VQQNEFRAYVVEEDNNTFLTSVKTRTFDELPMGDLLVKVHYSSLNYKDALSTTGNRGVTKNYPHVPGIDAVGVVEISTSTLFSAGDKVIVTSYDIGMSRDGGFSEYIRVPSEWVLKLPESLSMKEAMIYGTAGLTAGISVSRLIELVKPEDGTIVVSGATGGVGSLSVAILSTLGYFVEAITSKESEKEYLLNLGAKEIIDRKAFEKLDSKPLLKPLYAGGIDTVGGVILENIIKSIEPRGAVTCCGNVGSATLDLSVFPFILRGITFIGIDSQNYPHSSREKIWRALALDWKPSMLSDIYDEISLDEIDTKIALILQGKLKGRTVINMNKVT